MCLSNGFPILYFYVRQHIHHSNCSLHKINVPYFIITYPVPTHANREVYTSLHQRIGCFAKSIRRSRAAFEFIADAAAVQRDSFRVNTFRFT
jgi:hypothetical protein